MARLSRASGFLLLLLLLAWAAPAAAAINLVINASGSTATSVAGTQLVITPAAATGGGNTVVVVVSIRTTTASVTSITDSGGSTYTVRATSQGTAVRSEIWSTAANASLNSTTITVNILASVSWSAAAASYSGAGALGITNTGAGTSNPSISLATQDNNNWVVAGFATRGRRAARSGTGNLRQSVASTSGTNAGVALTDNTAASPSSVTNSVTSGAADSAMTALELRTVVPAKVCTGGNMSAGASWGGSVPVAGDTLRIDGACVADNAFSNLAYGTLEVSRGAAGTVSWPAGGTATLNVTTVLTGTFGAGTINMTNGGTLQIGTSWSSTNTTLTPGTGTVNWNVTGANSTLPAGVATYNNLTITATGRTASLGVATTVNGNLLISAGTLSVSASNFALNVKGNFTNNATFTQGTGTVTLNGTVAQAIGGSATTTFNNLTISNTSAAVSANTNFNVSGTLTVNANAVLTPAAAVVVGGAGTLTGSGTVQVTRTAATADFSSQYTITNKTLTNLTVEYNGAAAQVVSALTYGGLKINNASGVTMPGNATVGAVLTLTSGVVTTGANTLITTANCPGSVSRTGGRVAGFLRLQIPTGSPTCTFDVGDGTTYRPMNLTFTSVTTAGNLTGSVSQAAGDHPNISTSGLDANNSVNRFWTLTNSGLVLTSYNATFNFVAGDVDAGADPLTFEVERWNGSAWNTTTAGTRTSTSTQATGITAFGDFASGKKKFGNPATDSFNAFETATAAGAITGKIFTKLVVTAFNLDVVAIQSGAQLSGFTSAVLVELVANTTGAALGSDNCPTTFTSVQTVSPNPTITGGRSTVSFAAVSTAYRDVRVRVRYPVASPTVTSCSTDNFSIRPTGFTVTSTNATQTNTSGTPAIKTGANFNLTAASVMGYDGTPSRDNTKVVGTPTLGTIGGSFGAAPVGTGTATGASFFYSEVGNFGLNANAVYDSSFTSVDQPSDCTADFSNALVGGKYGCSFGSAAVAQSLGVSGFGRFIPDNFNVTYSTTPVFGTGCGTFSYVGKTFSYSTAPAITVTARNGTTNGLANATTTNYAGAYMKFSNAAGTSLNQAPYDTQLGRYPRFDALGGGTTPALNPAGLPATTADPVIGTFAAGVATLTFGSGTGLAFTRSTTTPNAPFNADIALALNVIDTDGVAFAGNPASFGAATAGNGIAFSAGKQMRFGRMRLGNAFGTTLLDLPLSLTTEYYNSSGVFVTNTNDSCTTILASDVIFSFVGGTNLTACKTQMSPTGTLSFNSGVASVKLTKPTSPPNDGAVDLTVNLGTAVGGSMTCVGPVSSSATGANKAWLQGNWGAVTYDKNPQGRASFGVYKAADEFIYLREVY